MTRFSKIFNIFFIVALVIAVFNDAMINTDTIDGIINKFCK